MRGFPKSTFAQRNLKIVEFGVPQLGSPRSMVASRNLKIVEFWVPKSFASSRLFSSLEESQESIEESRQSLEESRPISHDFGVPKKVHHVCELQFNLKKMIDVKESAAGHGSYERIRLFCGQTLLLVFGRGKVT